MKEFGKIHGVYGQGDWDSRGLSFLFVLNITIERFFHRERVVLANTIFSWKKDFDAFFLA